MFILKRILSILSNMTTKSNAQIFFRDQKQLLIAIDNISAPRSVICKTFEELRSNLALQFSNLRSTSGKDLSLR